MLRKLGVWAKALILVSTIGWIVALGVGALILMVAALVRGEKAPISGLLDHVVEAAVFVGFLAWVAWDARRATRAIRQQRSRGRQPSEDKGDPGIGAPEKVDRTKPDIPDDGGAGPAQPPFQFSLRSLLVVTTLCAVCFSALRTMGVELALATMSTGMIYLIMVVSTLVFRQGVIRARAADRLSLERIASVASEVDAAILVARLSEAGIRAQAEGGTIAGFAVMAPGDVHVVVARQDAERARRVLLQTRSDAEVDSGQEGSLS